MKLKANQFAVFLTLLAVACQLIIFFFYENIAGKKPTLLIQTFPAYFLIINLIIHILLIKAAHKSPRQFVNAFMAFTTGKMMISLMFIVVIALTNKPDFKAPVLTFTVLYLLFMVLEVVFILKDLKKLKNNP